MASRSSHTPRHDIAFLHTAAGHVLTFGRLMDESAPHLNVRHDVDETLLAAALMAGGIEPALEERIGRAMIDAGSTGARVVVCTCSTIGGVAERAGARRALITQRIDRAMADAAVEMGPRILLAAALGSTVSPTRALINSSAARIGKPVSFEDMVIDDAWPYFERGLQETYIERIAVAVIANAADIDVVVLAQASMAGAAELCRSLPVPVLSSPRLGVEAAIQAYKRTMQSDEPTPEIQE